MLRIFQAVEKASEVAKPNFATSGLLAKETNTVKGVELKYNEPPEARKPLMNWRLYVFKGKEQIGGSAPLTSMLLS
jgi:smad nuclear-interacting protein 1